jgi:hypothetical protein
MLRCLPKQFGVRSLLLFVALAALSIVLVQQYLLLKRAREKNNRTWALRQVKQLNVEEVVAASETLFQVEKTSLWISESAARRQHLHRLERLLDDVDSSLSEPSPDFQKRSHDYVLKRIDALK